MDPSLYLGTGQSLHTSQCGAEIVLDPSSHLDPSLTLDLGGHLNFDLSSRRDIGSIWDANPGVGDGLGLSKYSTDSGTCHHHTTPQPLSLDHCVGSSPMTLVPKADTDLPYQLTQLSNSSVDLQQGSRPLENKGNLEFSDLQWPNDQRISDDHTEQGTKYLDGQFCSSSPTPYQDTTRYRCALPNCKKTFKRKEHARRHFLTYVVGIILNTVRTELINIQNP